MKKSFKKIIFFLIFSICAFDLVSLANEIDSSNKEAKINNSAIKENSFLEIDPYLIGPGDKVKLTFYDNSNFDNIYTVLGSGSLHLPLVGTIDVQNKTLDQATKILETAYGEHLLAPGIHLSIAQPRSLEISIIGEVLRPGLYSLIKGKGSDKLPTVVDAIQKAGGITQIANIKDVTLTRLTGSETLSRKKTSLNLLNLILKGEQYQNLILHDGDIITINKRKNIQYENLDIAVANLSPKTINVTILGEVSDPGPKLLMANTPLVKAIYHAGGPIAFTANYSNVALIRTNRDGSSSIEKYKINLKEKLSAKKNPPLTEGDIIKVYPNSLKKVSDGLSVVTSPLSSVVTAVTSYKILTD